MPAKALIILCYNQVPWCSKQAKLQHFLVVTQLAHPFLPHTSSYWLIRLISWWWANRNVLPVQNCDCRHLQATVVADAIYLLAVILSFFNKRHSLFNNKIMLSVVIIIFPCTTCAYDYGVMLCYLLSSSNVSIS